MAILSIQSHVAYGHVGNRSAVFPLERLGFEVWPINTVQFSNHTGYGAWKGEVFTPEHIDLVWNGMKERGAAADCEAVLSGYMGDPGIGESVLRALADVRAANPGALYCCDPVMGDYGRGFFVRPGIPEFMKSRAIPAADLIKPNQFEAEALTGMTIRTLADARRACSILHDMGPGLVLLTSFKPEFGEDGYISMLLSDRGTLYRVRTPELPLVPAPNGAGDLVSALFLGQYLKTGNPQAALELMADSVYSVFERSFADGSRELRLVQSQDSFVSGGRRFAAEAL
ncbi:MAG: pyridoxal kinase PdxY [Rectinemataceae bacterium]